MRKDGGPERLGRWINQSIQIKGTEITFITAYRVCKTHINLETNMAYAQQWKEMATKNHKKIDPRVKTIHDLKNYIKKETEKEKLC